MLRAGGLKGGCSALLLLSLLNIFAYIPVVTAKAEAVCSVRRVRHASPPRWRSL